MQEVRQCQEDGVSGTSVIGVRDASTPEIEDGRV